MNIWIVNHYAVPPTATGGTRHYALAAELIRGGHQVTVIASSFDHFDSASREEKRLKPGETARLEMINAVPFLWVRSSPYGGYVKRMYNMVEFALRIRYGKDVRKLPRPDIILGSTLTLFAAFGAHKLARKLGVPFVLEVRDVWPQTLIDFGMSRWNPGVVMFGMIERHLYRNADAIVTLLPGAIEHIRKNGARTQEIICLPNAVDFTVAPPPTRPSDELPFKVVFAGTHSQANSPETLLQAAALLQTRGHRDIQICFVGDGPSKTELRRLGAEQGLSNVVFRDPVPKREVYGVLSEAGAVVALLKNLTLYRFGTSLNKLYDYMSAARPVLFAARSLNDPVSDSGCGVVIPPENPEALADAIMKLARMTPEERWEMGLRGRKYVEEHHDFAKLAAKLEDLMIRTAKSHNKSGFRVMDNKTGGDPKFPGYRTIKRTFDLALTVMVSTVAVPLSAILALLLWITQRKVLFRQLRPGLHGRPFTLYKFRTMNDARDVHGELLPDEQRITRIGSFIRSLSLDELPQLWNVFKGEMSLVGPRPLLMEYLPRYTAHQARRHEVKPGITGWAQVNGRNAIEWEEKFVLDVWYVDHKSFLLDLRILWITGMRVVRRSGISSQGHATMPVFMGKDIEG